MSVAPPPVRPASGGRHRVPDGAPTGSFVSPTEPFATRTGSFGAAPAGAGVSRHAAAPSVSFSRAARTAGISLAALGALAAAGGFATQGIGGDAPATGEAALGSLAAADLALAPAAPAPPGPAAVTAPSVLPLAAQEVVPAKKPTSDDSANTASGSRSSSGSKDSASTASAGSSMGAQAVSAAKRGLGKPYVWGATGPSSFDCSGLMVWSYKQAGKSLPRTASAQSKVGQKVSMNDLRPGDLIFMYSPVSHVAMYIGNNQVIEAPTAGKNVRIKPLSTVESRAVGVRRMA